MARDDEEEKVRVHCWIYKRDVERLDSLWGATVGRSKAICTIIRSTLNTIDAKAQQSAKTLPAVEIDLT